MKGAVISLLFFVLGCLLPLCGIIPIELVDSDWSTYALYALMLLVGISLGMDKKALDILKKANIGMLLVPLSIAVGSILGAGLSYLFVSESFREGMAVGAGFGYYSLSSIIISESHPVLGIIALLSNILRELIALIAAPVFVKYFGKLSPIAAAGATSMDTVLPIIRQYSGKDYVIISLFSGIVLTILVPVLIPVIL